MTVCAIIPAAGQGNRMGSPIPKQFLELDGKPILEHTLSAFQECGEVDSVILVVPEREVESTSKDYLGKVPIVHQVVAGGEKRQDSVYCGMQALPKGVDLVLVHDAVRPFVEIKIICNVLEAAEEHGAAITAIPVNDTLKRANTENFVETTVSRENLWRVQTPQGFKVELLLSAFRKAFAEGFYGTDEGAVVEYFGKPVKIVNGSELNIKITRPEDLVLGNQILQWTKKKSQAQTSVNK